MKINKKIITLGIVFMSFLQAGSAFAACDKGYEQTTTIFNSTTGHFQSWAKCVSSNGPTSIVYKEDTGSIPSTNWTNSTTVLTVGGLGSFDEKNVHNPSVVLYNGTYYMYYHGSDKNSINNIGLATSNDGINWTKYKKNISDTNPTPVLVPTTGSWDTQAVSSPSILIENNGVFKIWYVGSNGSGNVSTTRFRIGYATSTDGINFTKNSNFVLDINSGSGWDNKRVVFPRVIKANGFYHMLYSGENYSVKPNGDHYTNYDYNIGYATSNDGITWVKTSNSGLFYNPNNIFSVYAGEIVPVTINNVEKYIMYFAQDTTASDGTSDGSQGGTMDGPYIVKSSVITLKTTPPN